MTSGRPNDRRPLAEGTRYDVALGSIHYRRVGAGPPMLLMHDGPGLDHSTLRPWLDPLSREVELIFYDHLGNGRSPYTGAWADVDDALWVQTADGLRRHLGHDRVIVFGHGYGGLLALEFALRFPGSVTGLIVCGAGPSADDPERILTGARLKASSPATMARLIDFLSGPAADDDELADGFDLLNPLLFHTRGPEYSQQVLANVEFRAAPANHARRHFLPAFDVTARLGDIRVPTLILSGAADWLMPPDEAGGRLAAGIRGAEHVIFGRSGHWPFVEERDHFLGVVVDWLRRIGLSRPGDGAWQVEEDLRPGAGRSYGGEE